MIREDADNLSTLITTRSTWLLDTTASTERTVHILDTCMIGVFREKFILPLEVSIILIASRDKNVVITDFRE